MKVTSKDTANPDNIPVRIPFRVVKRGGRKEMQLPECTAQPDPTDATLV